MTAIPYCDETLEVTGGCTKCSLGCANCWAVKEVWRMAHNPLLGDKWQGLVEKKDGVLNWTGKIVGFYDALDIPLNRKKPIRYFIDSKSDLFHKKVPFEFIDKVFAVATLCPQHTFLILTKRADRALEYVLQEPRGEIDHAITDGLTYFVGRGKKYAGKGLTKHLRNKTQLWPLPNIHFGVSISNQAEADEKIPILLQIPAAVRFLSIEPMLGPIDLIGKDKSRMGKTGYLANYFIPFFCNHCGRHISKPPDCATSTCRYCGGHGEGHRQEKSIHGVIVGCESGPKRRPCKIEWVESVVEQCKTADVPCFVKQISLNGKVVKMPNGFPQEYPERR